MEAITFPRPRRFSKVGRVLKSNGMFRTACLVLLALLILAILGPQISPYDPFVVNSQIASMPPSAQHWMGTDHLGRDVLTRIIHATGLDLWIAFSAVIASAMVGTALGGISAYFGGVADRILGRLIEIIMAFPLFVLAFGIVALMGNSLENIIFATAVINVPFYARVSRAQVSGQMSASWLEAARSCGCGDARILFAYMLPIVAPIVVVQMSVNMGWAILNAAGLSFLGLGVRAPTPEWGVMVAEGANWIDSGAWWMSICPGLVMFIAILAFNMLGDGLRDLFDPRGVQ